MSSFKNFSSMLNDLQQQADGRGTLDGSAIEDFLSIAGYKMPAGGGGGDSDFETVTVTLANSSESNFYSAEGFAWIDPSDTISSYSIFVNGGSSQEEQVVLYKGEAFMVANDYDYDTPPVITGDIIDDEGTFIIKGAGSITLVGTGGMS